MTQHNPKSQFIDSGLFVRPLVYVLRLEGDRFYCGVSAAGLHARLATHFCGKGSRWTKLHTPVSIHSVQWGGTDVEREVTINLCKKYGPEAVRGGPWCSLDRPPPFPKEDPKTKGITYLQAASTDTSLERNSSPPLKAQAPRPNRAEILELGESAP